MKIQIDIDHDTWSKFREKVQSQGKTLREVVPTVIDPALKAYVSTVQGEEWVWMKIPDSKPVFPELVSSQTPLLKRCEVCDKMVDRLFHIPTGRACYQCWRSLQ